MALGNITLDQLVRPNKELECILRDIVCKYNCGGEGYQVELIGTTLVFKVSDQVTTIELSTFLNQYIIDGIKIQNNELIFQYGDTTTTINFTNLIKENETITTLVDNEDGTYTYTSENGTQTVINTNISKNYLLKNAFETNELEILIPR